MQDFHAGMYQANLLYGVDLLEDDYEEIALVAWLRIGNKIVRTFRYCTTIDCNNKGEIELPCNADIIEAVTYGFEDWNYTDNVKPNGDINSAFTEGYIESRKSFPDPLYISGKFVKYERVGDTIYINPEFRGPIHILYRGVLLDDDGLPQLTDKEVDAIAAYCAYVVKYKLYLQTLNRELLNAALTLLAEWNRLCDAARVSDYVNQNEMNKILDAKTSWNRKSFNKSYKIKY